MGDQGKGKTPSKLPFDVDQVFLRVREAVRPFPKAALFELAEEGFRSPFEQLVACIISTRTLDEVTLPTARRLFALARTPLEVVGFNDAGEPLYKFNGVSETFIDDPSELSRWRAQLGFRYLFN